MATQKKKPPLTATDALTKVLESKQEPKTEPESESQVKPEPESKAEPKPGPTVPSAKTAIVPSAKTASPDKDIPQQAKMTADQTQQIVNAMVAMFDRIYFVEIKSGQICTDKVNRSCFMKCKHYGYCSGKEKILVGLLPEGTNG